VRSEAQDFAVASADNTYLFDHGDTPETRATDPAALTAMVLPLDAQNEQLRAVMQTLKDLIFNARSERFTALTDEQLAPDLCDLGRAASRQRLRRCQRTRPLWPEFSCARTTSRAYAYRKTLAT
jgi:hypothetical protein